MPRYYVMIGIMDSSLANIAGHAFLAVLRWNGLGHKIQVEKAWGYYGAPQSGPDSPIGAFKAWMKLGYDFTNSFGELQEEKLRFLDVGTGIKGKVFAIDDDQYQKLLTIINQRLLDQREAIEEISNELKQKHIKVNSKAIFKEELKRKKPRLKRFDLKVSLGWPILNLNSAQTCKTLLIEILEEIGIPKAELSSLTASSQAIPRFSGKLDDIVLHSIGKINRYESANKPVSFFRQWKDDAKLYCSFPLQNVVGATSNVKSFFYVKPNVAEISKKYLAQLQAIEKIVQATEVDEKYLKYKNNYLARLREVADAFAIVRAGTDYNELNDAANYFLSASYFVVCDPKNNFDEPEYFVGILPYDVREQICAAMGKTLVDEYFSPAL